MPLCYCIAAADAWGQQDAAKGSQCCQRSTVAGVAGGRNSRSACKLAPSIKGFCSDGYVLLQGETMKAGKRVQAQHSAGAKGSGKRTESGEIYKKWLKHNGAKAGKDAAASGKGGASAFGSR